MVTVTPIVCSHLSHGFRPLGSGNTRRWPFHGCQGVLSTFIGQLVAVSRSQCLFEMNFGRIIPARTDTWLITMVIVSPPFLGLWDPPYKWRIIINGGTSPYPRPADTFESMDFSQLPFRWDMLDSSLERKYIGQNELILINIDVYSEWKLLCWELLFWEQLVIVNCVRTLLFCFWWASARKKKANKPHWGTKNPTSKITIKDSSK